MNRLLACRVCLAFSTRLCSIMDGQFQDIYEKLVGASLDTTDILPTSVCYICFSLMKKMLQFRERSQKANKILQRMISSGLEPSVSSLNMLVKDQTGMSWTLRLSDIERTSTTTGKVEVQVKIEPVEEMDIDRTSDRIEDYPDSMPVHRDPTSDTEDDLPLQNISKRCKTDSVNIQKTHKVILKKSSGGDEGATPPEKRKLDNNEAENKFVNSQARLRKPKKYEEPREKKISEKQNDSAFNKNDTVGFKCEICEKCFSDKGHLTSHLRVHTKEKPFKCDICKKGFSFNALLTRHLRIHTKEKPFKCDICEKCFSVKGHVKRHLSVHTKEKHFKCDLCEKRFSDKGHLTSHLRVHNKEKPFKCDFCKKGFSFNALLTRHLRIHTKEKPFKCDICGKCFSFSGSLTRHLRVHTKEKPFKCDICGNRFSQHGHLTNHLRVHTKEKPFKCPLCKKAFSVNVNLVTHLRTHSGEKPYSCSYCIKSFISRSHLKSHILRIHSK